MLDFLYPVYLFQFRKEIKLTIPKVLDLLYSLNLDWIKPQQTLSLFNLLSSIYATDQHQTIIFRFFFPWSKICQFFPIAITCTQMCSIFFRWVVSKFDFTGSELGSREPQVLHCKVFADLKALAYLDFTMCLFGASLC